MGGMEMNGNESAAALKAKSRKTVTLPEAQVAFEIRKLMPRDFISCIDVVRQLDIPQHSALPGPDEKEAVVEKRRKHIQETVAASAEYQKAFLAVVFGRGVVAPKILMEDDQVAGEGEVNAFDIPSGDLPWLINQIIDFAGLGTEAQAIEFFRGKALPDDGAPGPDGGEVREVAS